MMNVRSIRVRRENIPAMLQALRAAGIEASHDPSARPHSRWLNGCSDPLCCSQHWGVTQSPQEWGVIRAACSGRRAHLVWVAAGIVPANGRRDARRALRAP